MGSVDQRACGSPQDATLVHRSPRWRAGFKADRSLSDEEIATITRWVDAGAPRGNLTDLPPPRELDDMDKWHIGEPDWVVPIPAPFVVEAEACPGRTPKPRAVADDTVLTATTEVTVVVSPPTP